MLNANNTCQIYSRSGGDVYGQSSLASTPVTERCCVIRLERKLEPTTVRADSSGSRGHGDEMTLGSRLLLDARTVARLGDQISVAGVLLRVTGMNPVFDAVSGEMDHYAVTGEAWG